jgi:transcriptional regulator with XRE-family HTH domain
MIEGLRAAIGGRLKECREAAGLSQANVAQVLRCKRQTVSAWERGKAMPASREWYTLGPLYGVSLDYLVYGVRTIPVSRHAIMERVFRPQVSQPAAAASGTLERLPAS